VPSLALSQPSGARVVFEDSQGTINLLNPVNDQVRAWVCGPGWVGSSP